MPLALILAPLLLAQGMGPEQGVGAMREGTVPRHSGISLPAIGAPPAIAEPPSRLQTCLSAAQADPAAGKASAAAWLQQARGSAQAEPLMCLGWADSAAQDWDAASREFIAGRDSAAASDNSLRARLGAMAGNADLAAGAADRALAVLDTAHGDAVKAADAHLRGDIAIDRARALVAMKREADAATALDEARLADPNNPDGWLLSATLSRRQGHLAEAQTRIQAAAQLSPADPEIALEAGVIAVLSGRKEEAAKSWRSIIVAAPDSPSANTARGYLAQLGSAPAPASMRAGG